MNHHVRATGTVTTRVGWNILIIMACGALLGTAYSAPAEEPNGNPRENGIEEVRIHVDGLACPFCAFNIEKRLLRLEGVRGDDQIDVSIAEGLVTLEWQAGIRFDPGDVNDQIRRSGFTPKNIEVTASGTSESPGGETPGHLHLLTGADEPVVIVASDEPREAERYAALKATILDSEEPISIRIEGTVRQDGDAWALALQKWETQ